jgi:quercetin dioxygenase-like cupin family protein
VEFLVEMPRRMGLELAGHPLLKGAWRLWPRQGRIGGPWRASAQGVSMNEAILQVAARIKELRLLFQVELEALAEESQISPALYRQYESGETDIPVGVLFGLANRFKVELSSLLTGEEPRLHTYALTRRGQGIAVDRRQDYEYQNLAHAFAHKRAEYFMVTVSPKDEGASVPLNSHPGQEFDHLLEGSLLVMVGSHEIRLNPGDSLCFDSGIPHGMKALGGTPAKFLAVIS